jgi:hypothetical protein
MTVGIIATIKVKAGTEAEFEDGVPGTGRAGEAERVPGAFSMTCSFEDAAVPMS